MDRVSRPEVERTRTAFRMKNSVFYYLLQIQKNHSVLPLEAVVDFPDSVNHSQSPAPNVFVSLELICSKCSLRSPLWIVLGF